MLGFREGKKRREEEEEGEKEKEKEGGGNGITLWAKHLLAPTMGRVLNFSPTKTKQERGEDTLDLGYGIWTTLSLGGGVALA